MLKASPTCTCCSCRCKGYQNHMCQVTQFMLTTADAHGHCWVWMLWALYFIASLVEDERQLKWIMIWTMQDSHQCQWGGGQEDAWDVWETCQNKDKVAVRRRRDNRPQRQKALSPVKSLLAYTHTRRHNRHKEFYKGQYSALTVNSILT